MEDQGAPRRKKHRHKPSSSTEMSGGEEQFIFDTRRFVGATQVQASAPGRYANTAVFSSRGKLEGIAQKMENDTDFIATLGFERPNGCEFPLNVVESEHTFIHDIEKYHEGTDQSDDALVFLGGKHTAESLGDFNPGTLDYYFTLLHQRSLVTSGWANSVLDAKWCTLRTPEGQMVGYNVPANRDFIVPQMNVATQCINDMVFEPYGKLIPSFFFHLEFYDAFFEVEKDCGSVIGIGDEFPAIVMHAKDITERYPGSLRPNERLDKMRVYYEKLSHFTDTLNEIDLFLHEKIFWPIHIDRPDINTTLADDFYLAMYNVPERELKIIMIDRADHPVDMHTRNQPAVIIYSNLRAYLTLYLHYNNSQKFRQRSANAQDLIDTTPNLSPLIRGVRPQRIYQTDLQQNWEHILLGRSITSIAVYLNQHNNQTDERRNTSYMAMCMLANRLSIDGELIDSDIGFKARRVWLEMQGARMPSRHLLRNEIYRGFPYQNLPALTGFSVTDAPFDWIIEDIDKVVGRSKVQQMEQEAMMEFEVWRTRPRIPVVVDARAYEKIYIMVRNNQFFYSVVFNSTSREQVKALYADVTRTDYPAFFAQGFGTQPPNKGFFDMQSYDEMGRHMNFEILYKHPELYTVFDKYQAHLEEIAYSVRVCTARLLDMDIVTRKSSHKWIESHTMEVYFLLLRVRSLILCGMIASDVTDPYQAVEFVTGLNQDRILNDALPFFMKRPVMFMQSTFFFRLHEDLQVNGSHLDVEKYVNGLKAHAPTSGNIFDHEYVMIPYNVSRVHWILYIVNPNKRELVVFDPFASGPTTAREGVESDTILAGGQNLTEIMVQRNVIVVAVTALFDLIHFREKGFRSDQCWKLHWYKHGIQADSYNCGLFVMLAANLISIGGTPLDILNDKFFANRADFEQVELDEQTGQYNYKTKMDMWRKHIACELVDYRIHGTKYLLYKYGLGPAPPIEEYMDAGETNSLILTTKEQDNELRNIRDAAKDNVKKVVQPVLGDLERERQKWGAKEAENRKKANQEKMQKQELNRLPEVDEQRREREQQQRRERQQHGFGGQGASSASLLTVASRRTGHSSSSSSNRFKSELAKALELSRMDSARARTRMEEEEDPMEEDDLMEEEDMQLELAVRESLEMEQAQKKKKKEGEKEKKKSRKPKESQHRKTPSSSHGSASASNRPVGWRWWRCGRRRCV